MLVHISPQEADTICDALKNSIDNLQADVKKYEVLSPEVFTVILESLEKKKKLMFYIQSKVTEQTPK